MSNLTLTFNFDFIFSSTLTDFVIKLSLVFFLRTNFLLVFLLYVSVWRNMELESPIRYFLNLLHLTIVYEFLMIEEIKNK